MPNWHFTIILLAIYAAGVHSLQCFICLGDECESINDSMSKYCGPQITTTAPPLTTTDLAIESTTTTTDTQETILDTTVESKTTSTDTQETTEELVETTVGPTENTADTAAPEEYPTGPQQLGRKRRYLSLNPVLSFQDEVLKNYQLRLRATRANPSYFCYSATIPDGDGTKRKHGCVEVQAEKAACDAVREVNNIPPNTNTNYDCQYCQTDNCNGSTKLRLSIFTLLAALLAQKFFLNK